MFAEAVRRTHNGESVSYLFENVPYWSDFGFWIYFWSDFWECSDQTLLLDTSSVSASDKREDWNPVLLCWCKPKLKDAFMRETESFIPFLLFLKAVDNSCSLIHGASFLSGKGPPLQCTNMQSAKICKQLECIPPNSVKTPQVVVCAIYSDLVPKIDHSK